VDGQIRGGTAQGIGTCIYEKMPFDQCGQPLAGTLVDYLLPGASEIPQIRILHLETPSPYTSLPHSVPKASGRAARSGRLQRSCRPSMTRSREWASNSAICRCFRSAFSTPSKSPGQRNGKKGFALNPPRHKARRVGDMPESNMWLQCLEWVRQRQENMSAATAAFAESRHRGPLPRVPATVVAFIQGCQ
jgi:hypothetical protein